MALTQIEDHDQLAKDKLAQQFKSKDNVARFLETFSRQIQELENVSFQLLLERALCTAVGEQLDGLGSIIGLLRDSPDDELYRFSLQAEIAVLTSGGTIEDLIQMVDAALGDVPIIQLIESPPAALLIIATEEAIDPDVAARVPAKVARAKAAGVLAQFIWSESDTNFKLSDVSQVVGGNGPISATEGYADTAQTSGGPYTGVA
jgi:hypothetical protein